VEALVNSNKQLEGYTRSHMHTNMGTQTRIKAGIHNCIQAARELSTGGAARQSNGFWPSILSICKVLNAR